MNVEKALAELRRMTVTQLRRRYEDVFGEQTRSNHKQFLIRRLAWRMQANEEGGLSDRARQRAMELANDADLRLGAPTKPLARIGPNIQTITGTLSVAADDRLPLPGALLTRDYKGRRIVVRVLPKGFEYGGEGYRSLSAIAQKVTGSHWNGWLFFGIKPPAKQLPRKASA
jgi:hypothetical protein